MMTMPITAGKDDAPLDDGRRKRIRRMCNDVVGYQISKYFTKFFLYVYST